MNRNTIKTLGQDVLCVKVKRFQRIIDLNSIKNTFCLFHGDLSKIKNSPFGEKSFAQLFMAVESISCFDYIQLTADINTSQLYYRGFLDGAFTNWIFFPVDEVSEAIISQIKQLKRLFVAINPGIEPLKQVLRTIKEMFSSEIPNINKKISDDHDKYVAFHDKCIVSFVDDDSSAFIDTVWKKVCFEKRIRIGFACVTGFINGACKIKRPEDKQISLESLKDYYRKGFDIYSHSYSHAFFYEPSIKPKMIESECEKSKDFLIDNGFYRCSNTIVYPGGLGLQRIRKKRVIKKYFKYGIDTVGHGINETIDDYCIRRLNLDVNEYEEITKWIDIALEKRCLLVFMSHSYELNKCEQQRLKVIKIIDYVQSKGILIMPFSEAIRIKDYSNNKKSKRFSLSVFAKEVHMDFVNIRRKNKK